MFAHGSTLKSQVFTLIQCVMRLATKKNNLIQNISAVRTTENEFLVAVVVECCTFKRIIRRKKCISKVICSVNRWMNASIFIMYVRAFFFVHCGCFYRLLSTSRRIFAWNRYTQLQRRIFQSRFFLLNTRFSIWNRASQLLCYTNTYIYWNCQQCIEEVNEKLARYANIMRTKLSVFLVKTNQKKKTARRV